jgi:predicted  nucleic acid-binding Zn-ribbon protein
VKQLEKNIDNYKEESEKLSEQNEQLKRNHINLNNEFDTRSQETFFLKVIQLFE